MSSRRIVRRDRLERLIGALEQHDGALEMCGWHTCAVGIGIRLGVFEEEGFVFFDYAPQHNRCLGWDAVDSFFGLTREQSLHLFYYESYPDTVISSRDAIARIREFLAAQQKTSIFDRLPLAMACGAIVAIGTLIFQIV